MHVPRPMDRLDSAEPPADDSVAQDPEAPALRQYAALESLIALLPAAHGPQDAAGPARARVSTLCHVALRAALAPALRPYRDDPLRPLDGQFVSVDAQIEALLAFARSQDLLEPLLAGLPHADRCCLPPDPAAFAAKRLSSGEAPAAPEDVVGSVWGSLYLPAARAALPCRVWAAYDTGAARRGGAEAPASSSARGSGWRWGAPRPVRAVSADVAAAARDALSAALTVLGRRSAALLRAPLIPGEVFYDVCCPALADEGADPWSEGAASLVAGRSLGLPLALAFLSALTGLPVPPFVGATGALDGDGEAPDAVLPVEWVAEKAAAHLGLAPGARFVAPAPWPPPGQDAGAPAASPEVHPAEDLAAAARAALRGFSEAVDDGQQHAAAAPPPGGAPPPVGGRVALLRAEVDGAVRLWEAEPAAMRRAVAAYEALFHDAASARGGYVFGAGSAAGAAAALSAAFPDAAAACGAALDLLQGLLLRRWPEAIGSLRVRGGIHCGSAELFRGDYYGPALAQLARLTDAANAGQVLLSGAARDALAPPADADWHVVDLGKHRLRDLGEAMALYQLSRPGLPEAVDPPRSLNGGRHNLPVQVTSFVGRADEVAALRSLLIEDPDSGARLVTLFGPGGVGKTRLALQAAAECAAAASGEGGFDGGVWFVPLAEARTGDEAAAAVAQVLRAPAATPTRSLAEQVVATLEGAPGRTLLLLDNLESVLPRAAAFVGQIVRGAPRCTVVVTSRVLLNLRGERRFDVGPLPVPSEQQAHEDAVLARAAPAIALFRARAREVSPGFDRPAAEGGGGEASVPLLCAICRRLDGLPLAIELAAARARHLSLPEIERRLGDAFSLLVTRAQDAPERHRTLLATLHWSHELLDPEERRFFARLAVFAGGFTEEAAAAVTGRPDAFDLLTALEEKSLLRCVVGAEGESAGARFSLLHTVQAFARQRLAEAAGEEAAVAAAAHAGYYAGLARAAAPALDTPDEVAVFDALDREIDNLRAAHGFLSQSGHSSRLPGFVAAAGEFLYRRGHWREWAEWPHHALKAADAAPGGAAPEDLSRLHFFIAVASRNAEDREELAGRIAEALAHAERVEDDAVRLRLRADATNLRGMALLREGRFGEAEAALTEARSLYQKVGHARGEAVVLNNLGHAAYRAGDFARSRGYYGVSAEFCRANGDRRGLYHALNNVALMALEAGERESARDLFREALSLCRLQKDAILIGTAMLNLGDALEQCGEAHAALTLLVAAEQIFAKLGHPYRGEAAKYIERCCRDDEWRDAAARLRQEGGRRTLASLLAAEPAPAPLRLSLEPKTILLGAADGPPP